MPTPDTIPTTEDLAGESQLRSARRMRRGGLLLIGLVVLLAMAGLLGVRSSTAEAQASDGSRLSVRHVQVTRAGLAAPLHVTVRQPGGFDGPITIGISSGLMERFDFQNFNPNPAKETATADRLLYEFDPPPGEVLRLSLDARTAPDQNGSTSVYDVALLVEGRAVAEVSFRVWVVP